MNFKSPVFLCIPSLNITMAVPFQKVLEHLKESEICLHCKHFHQTEDWHEAPEGFYLPKGECLCHAPRGKGFPQVHGGKHCGEFSRDAG